MLRRHLGAQLQLTALLPARLPSPSLLPLPHCPTEQHSEHRERHEQHSEQTERFITLLCTAFLHTLTSQPHAEVIYAHLNTTKQIFYVTLTLTH